MKFLTSENQLHTQKIKDMEIEMLKVETRLNLKHQDAIETLKKEQKERINGLIQTYEKEKIDFEKKLKKYVLYLPERQNNPANVEPET